MASHHPTNWRQWVWADRARPPARRGISLRRAQTFLVFALLLFATFSVLSRGGPFWEAGEFDRWPFWLEQAGSEVVTAVSTLTEPEVGAYVVLALVNRPASAGARVAVDGREVASFEEWKVVLFVSGGEAISVLLGDEAAPIRVRVIASRGVRTPPLGREWSLVAGEVVLGSVILAE
ncbi:MAG: hypothetical protein R6U70_10715 [Bacillota bacterium]|jgi:hypothetical protein